MGGGSSISRGFKVIGAHYILIGNNFYAGKNCFLQTWESYKGKKTGYTPSLVIGDNVSMMTNCQISCVNSIEIGSGTLMGDNVFISDNNHGEVKLHDAEIMPIDRELSCKGAISIGQNVWLGRNVCVLGGVTIGDGSIIGANSVVTKSIPSCVVAAGAPARVIKPLV